MEKKKVGESLKNQIWLREKKVLLVQSENRALVLQTLKKKLCVD